VQSALPYVEYLAREVAGRVDVSGTQGKVKALSEVLPLLARMDNPVRRAAQVEMLASVFGIEDRLVLQELKEAVRDRRREVGGRAVTALASVRDGSDAETGLVRSLLDDAEVRAALLPEVAETDVASGRMLEIVRAVRRLQEAGAEVTYPRVAGEIGDAAREALTRIAAATHPPATLEGGRGCLRALRADRLQKEMKEITRRINTAGGGEFAELSLRKLDLKRQIEALGGVSV